ncbi:MAG: DUF72 domain-containing protein [Bryobacteraceae bacterium]
MSLPIRCGTAGWSYPHWNAVVYPKPKPRAFHPVEYLSEYFDTLEINSTFYRPVRPEISRLWASLVSANPQFRFTAKLAHRFTHERELHASEIGVFKDGLWPLWKAGRLGCLLMQFPWSFRYTEENREFFIRLRRTFHEFPLVAEMRHQSWMRGEALGTFIDYRVGFCNIDQPQFEKAMPPTAYLTSGIGYVRLLGRTGSNGTGAGLDDRATARNDYFYSKPELAEWAGRVQRVSAHADAVYVVTSNDAAGKSVVNALQMQTLLGTRAASAPAELLRRHRAALAGFHGPVSAQETLFAVA